MTRGIPELVPIEVDTGWFPPWRDSKLGSLCAKIISGQHFLHVCRMSLLYHSCGLITRPMTTETVKPRRGLIPGLWLNRHIDGSPQASIQCHEPSARRLRR